MINKNIRWWTKVKKILITISHDALTFSYKNSPEQSQKNLLNTNVISNDELLFSEEYIEKNKKIVSSFVEELIIEKEINKVIISNKELVFTVLKLIKRAQNIAELYFQEDFSLDYAICEKIIELKQITRINCYNVPMYLIELLDRYNITAECRCEIFFTSKFMMKNGLTQFAKIYYKMSVRFDIPLSKEDLNDFDTFCKINRYLKTIHLEGFSAKDINALLDILNENRIKNIKILIHADIVDPVQVNYLKRINKKYKKKHIQIKVSYSESYLKDNIFGQIVLNTLKICGIIGILIISSMFIYITYSNYQSAISVEKVYDHLDEVLGPSISDPIPNENTPSEEKAITPKMNALLRVNSDTVGWLKVNNTNIDYPVVQYEDNKHYLNYDYYQKKAYTGWVFMDYRNHKQEINKNTIIYGHNTYSNGLMFGSLHNVLKEEWKDDPNNLVIEFDNLTTNMKWRIFSIYQVKKTSDYIETEFEDDRSFIQFIEMITERSMYDFKVPVTKNDHILTLSTCANNNKRLVVHAVLINEE